MAHLIDKDALLAEIERRIKFQQTCIKAGYRLTGKAEEEIILEYNQLLSSLNSLEVKEVDLEKEIDKFYGMYRDKNGVTHDMQDNEICLDWKEDCNYHFKIDFAKHFFELGLKTKQE